MGRKTIEIKKLVEDVNRINRESTCGREIREGINVFLENILHETGNYNGFSYLDSKEVPENELPGIVFQDDGVNVFPDDSRRVYFHKGFIL